MSNTRIIVMQREQIIKLSRKGYSIRRISRDLGVHRNTVNEYLQLYNQSGIAYEEWEEKWDDLLAKLDKPTGKEKETEAYKKVINLLDAQLKNRKSTGFTIQNLYEDYVGTGGEYSRPQFYRITKEHWGLPKGSLKLEHKYGEQLFVDYCGKKLSYTDRSTGELIDVEMLVGILPASQYIYAEAMADQKQSSFTNGVINNLEYIGGVPKGIVSDNLKSAVTKAGKYQSTINKTLQGMALHYETTIDPTRPYRPKDKALVEGAVKIVYQQIYYHVSKHTHFSLAELNESIKHCLKELNDKRLTNGDKSRAEQYEDERQHLQPLPQYRYELKEYRRAKVQKMGYILCSEYKNYYSVPYRYIGKKVEVRYDSRTLEVYYNGERVATHLTNQAKGKYTTNKEHLCSNNKAYMEWSPEYFIKKASEKGPNIQRYVELLIDQKPYPEQAYKQIQGIFALCKQDNKEVVEKACIKGLECSQYSYFMIKQIVENRTYESLESTQNQEPEVLIPQHENVRGSQYYQ